MDELERLDYIFNRSDCQILGINALKVDERIIKQSG